MALSTQPYKGARDFYPEDKRLQKYIFGKLRSVVEQFGYEEYDAPIIEPLELYLTKTSEEIVNEQTYAFEDRGGRQVVIRPEMTPTVSRMVAASRQELAYPLRWYSIPNLWRYERPQHGRLREHWQLNVDIFGVEDIVAEQEIIMLADAIFKSFGAKPDMYTIKLNSRKFINYVLGDYLSLKPEQAAKMCRLIDHMHRLDRADFTSQADAICVGSKAGTVEKMLSVLDAGSFDSLPPALRDHPGLAELQKTMSLLHEAGVTNVVFDVTLMRGFDYYTDLVFELFDTHPDNNRAIMGGGRYDGLVALFGVEPLPTVGFGLGDVTLTDFLKIHELLPKLPAETDLYVAVVGDVLQLAQKAIAELRSKRLNLSVDLTGRKLDKQLSMADKKGLRYVLIIGQQEISTGQFTLKDLQTGKEAKLTLDQIAEEITKSRHSEL
jgi:histidyl-tRNA synthetase